MTISQKAIKHKKTALYVLLVYIAMQLSSFLLLKPFHRLVMSITGLPHEQAAPITQGWYIALSFAIALLVSLLLTSRDKNLLECVSWRKSIYSANVGLGYCWFLPRVFRTNNWCSNRNEVIRY